jgi:tetratricopeptide (TPR) repeat protein
MAKDALDRCQKLEPQDLEPLMLYGWLAHDKLQLEKAEANFMKIAKNDEAQPLLKARAYMGIADCQLSRMSRNANNRVNPEVAKNEALEALAAAKRADPSLADPYFHRAVLLNDLKRYPEAVSELQSLAGLNWLDRTLMKRVPEQMQRALNQQIATQ